MLALRLRQDAHDERGLEGAGRASTSSARAPARAVARTSLPRSPANSRAPRRTNAPSQYGYSNLRCLTESVKAEGILSLYNGAFANYMRLGPHTIVTFLVYERAREFIGIKPV